MLPPASRLAVRFVPLLLLLWSCGPDTTEPGPDTANDLTVQDRSIVLITVDTTRADRLQPYGADNVGTPTLLRLAHRSVVFEQAWSVAPITLVAHTSILSGLYPFEHGVRNNGIHYVSDSVTTLAERLRDAGYRTGAFVSAAVLDERYGLAQGFEIYDDDLSVRRNLSPRMVADRPAELTVDAALDWLDELGDDEPYFAWVHFYDPHASYSPPPPFRDEYRDRMYEGEIAYMDHEIGRLLSHPRLLGAGDETAGEPIVTVIGDHGESLGEHGERTHAILAYDSTLHVPWLLHVPGGPAGIRVPDPVGQVDLMPTLLSLVGLPMDHDAAPSGRDLTPLIQGRERRPRHPYYSETYLPLYTYGWAKLRVLHKERWKYIDAPAPELYDRRRDPRELTNLLELEKGQAHDLQRDLREWLGDDADREAGLELDSEAVAQLRSLGYLAVGSGGGPEVDGRPNPVDMIDLHVGLERARAFLADRLWDPAVRQLETVLRRDPNNLAAMLDLVRAREGQGEVEIAMEVAQRALSLDPDYVQTTMMLARLEARRENFGHALELIRIAIDKDPNNPDLRVQQASVYQRQGDWPAMERALFEILESNPDHPRANAFYAQFVEARTGEVEAALERLNRVVELDPFLDQAWLFRGRMLERTQRAEEAGHSYRAGLEKRPDDVELHGALGNLMARLGRRDEAIQHLREAIRLAQEPRTEFHVSLGALLAEVGRQEEAQREYDRVLALDPDHPGARNNAAIAAYRSGRLDEALAMLEAVVADFPRHADAHNNLAAIAVEQERWPDVVRHSRRTLEMRPDLVEAWNNLGIGLDETGEITEAREAYQKALDLAPEYWPARLNLGILYQRMGRPQEAVLAFGDVLALVPDQPDCHLALGELYAGVLDDPQRARSHWNAFLRHAPGHPREQEIRRRLAGL